MALTAILLVGCSKDEGKNKTQELENHEQAQYEKYVTPEVEGVLEKLGSTIHRGITPPNVEGYYLLYPKCIKTTVQNDSWLGSSNFFDHYKRFYDQKDLNLRLTSFEHGDYMVKHIGDGAFISGEGDKFSILFEEVNIVKRISKTYRQTVLTIYTAELARNQSGEVTGLKDFKYVLYMKDNDGDPNSIPNNTGRLFIPSSKASNSMVGVVSKTKFDDIASKFGSESAAAVIRGGLLSFISASAAK